MNDDEALIEEREREREQRLDMDQLRIFAEKRREQAIRYAREASEAECAYATATREYHKRLAEEERR